MILLLLRGLFIFLSAVVAAMYSISLLQSNLENIGRTPETQFTSVGSVAIAIIVAIVFSLGIVSLDQLTGRKKLAALSGVFLGLVVGLLAAYSLSFLVGYIGSLFSVDRMLLQGINVYLGVVCIYICVSMVLQTKDDFRFVIPYVEFAKEYRGTRPMVLDTSAIIDGRILDIASTHILQGLLIVPRFVLNELQTISDSADKLKRARGRRGLDIVAKLQNSPLIDMTIEDAVAEGSGVDQKLMALAQDLHARVVTTDFNLTKVAQLRGVEIININQLAEALRPVVLPGELMSVRIVKPGEGPGQGVGYLEDGTMVVVEQARDKIGQEIPLTVTSALQTSAGRMIFGRFTAPAASSIATPSASSTAQSN